MDGDLRTRLRAAEIEQLNETLASSEVTGEWRPPTRSLCQKSYVAPDPCDCGFLGDWEYRFVYVWSVEPGYVHTDRTKRQWLAEGFPVRDGGWWVTGGMDERCPQCGDIERFDHNMERVRCFSEQAKVVVFMASRR